MMRVLHILATMLVGGALLQLPAQARAGDEPDPRGLALYRDQVRSLLADRCLSCHGGKSTKGDFNLATRESLLESGMVEPGNSAASYLLEVVRHDQEPFMPFKQEKLTDEQIQLLTKWIDLGATYDGPLTERKPIAAGPMQVTDEERQTRSFRRLQPIEPPNVPNDSWSRTPVDRFVSARLAEHGLTPARPADRRTLIRRVYFDLIGLPPAPDEVSKFVADDSPQAYEELVDRLLANPHFGERWARHWLDIVRFAESHGFEHDHNRDSAYHYRDFVIQALNDDLPYDKFVQWQLAGDEIEPENPQALMATGFLAAGVHNTQITASQVEKERYDELDDIVGTIGTSMLGLTVGCARCHDHKYDPIPTSDYYRLVATFTTTVRSEKNVELNADQYCRDKAAFDAQLATLVAARDRYEREHLTSPLRDWATKPENLRALAETTSWIVLNPAQYTSVGYKDTGSATLRLLDDGSLLAADFNPLEDEYVVEVPSSVEGVTAVRLEALTHDSLPLNGPGRAANGNFALSDFSMTTRPAAGGETVKLRLQKPRATFEQNREKLSINASIDSDGTTGWAVDHGGIGDDQVAVFEFAEPPKTTGDTLLTFRLQFRGNSHHNLGRFRLSIARGSVPAGMRAAGVQQAAVETAQRMLRRIAGSDLESAAAAPSDEELAPLMSWFRTTDPKWRELDDKIATLLQTAPKRQMARVLYCSEGVPPLRLSTQGVDFFDKTYELERGDPNRKVREAIPGYLQIVTAPAANPDQWKINPPEGSKLSYRRRSLANWMTDWNQGAGHLLARVIVNRLWQHHFGRGLVATPSDFGMQGETATDPELIEWLASELIRGGWRLKPIHRLIVTSAVYMQDCQFDPAKNNLDPVNQWQWRYSPRRLEAELIRDQLLCVSGMLDSSLYGASRLEPDHTRRSIYSLLKRSEMPRMMQQFDCPDGLSGLAVRSNTTVAPQALLLMNNDHVQRWAKAFAERITGTETKPLADVVTAGFREALGRAPTEIERRESVAFLRRQESFYKEDGESEAYLMAVTDFCQAIFCLNEFVHIE